MCSDHWSDASTNHHTVFQLSEKTQVTDLLIDYMTTWGRGPCLLASALQLSPVTLIPIDQTARVNLCCCFVFCFFSWLPLIEQTQFHTRHTHIPDSYTQTSLAVYLRTNTQTPTSKSILNTHITPDVKRFNFRLPGVFPFFFYATIFFPSLLCQDSCLWC